MADLKFQPSVVQDMQLSAPDSVGQVNNNSHTVQPLEAFYTSKSVTGHDREVLLYLVGPMILGPSRDIVGVLKKEVFSPYGCMVFYDANEVREFSIEKASLFSKSYLCVRGAIEPLKIKGTLEEKDYSIYTRDKMIAQMESMGNDEFKVNVYSGAHYELVIKLFAALQFMNRSTSSTREGGCCKRVFEAFGDIGQGLTGITNCFTLCQSEGCF